MSKQEERPCLNPCWKYLFKGFFSKKAFNFSEYCANYSLYVRPGPSSCIDLVLCIRLGPSSCSGLGKHGVWWRRHLIHKQMKWFILLETLDLDQFWSLGLGTIFSLRKFNEICIVKIKQGLMDLRLLLTDMMSVNLHWSFDILTLMGSKAWQGPVTTKAWEILLFLP